MTTFAQALGFEKERIERLTLGSLLHDIGNNFLRG
jgi:HD-GYP domain-containing protein (c-di-GMP phosphodiesterase class II)